MQKENDNSIYDIAIIGGGINGVAVARDAALRGLKVYLCEKGDLAQGTSSVSSKLIHGGLRYLEHYDFSLVRKALKEREILHHIAPHIVSSLKFVLPHAPHLRSRLLIRLGLFLYDNLFRSRIFPRSKKVKLQRTAMGESLKPQFTHGFTYSDGWTNDVRLTVLNAISAHHNGAAIKTNTNCINAEYTNNIWQLTVQSKNDDQQTIQAKTLVNAAGPWAEKLLNDLNLADYSKKLSLVKGSHIVVPKLFEHNNAYILQTHDERIVFALPYEGSFTLIGTTDIPHNEDPALATTSAEEATYLCNVINQYFKEEITPQDIIWQFSGVRPLIDDGDGNASKASRDFLIEAPSKDLPLVNIWGGKLTTHRIAAEQVLTELKAYLPNIPQSKTATTPLPGGNIQRERLNNYISYLQQTNPWLPASITNRYCRSYGTLAEIFLEGKNKLADLGTHFGGGLYQAEVDYLCSHEWATTTDDILWRRTKMGLHLSLDEQASLKEYLKTKRV